MLWSNLPSKRKMRDSLLSSLGRGGHGAGGETMGLETLAILPVFPREAMSRHCLPRALLKLDFSPESYKELENIQRRRIEMIKVMWFWW